MHKTHLNIQANGKKAVIKLTGKIDPKANFFEAFQTEFKKLEAAGVTKATLEINSVGGSVIQGIKIYNLIEESPIEVTKEVVMLAASMSAVIAAGGVIRKSARMMFHKPFMQDMKGSANSTDLRTLADMLDKFEAKMINMVSVSTSLGEDEIKAKFFQEGKDVWLTSDDAVESGIMTGYSDAKPNASIPDNWLELASYEVAAKFVTTQKELKTPVHKMDELEVQAVAKVLGMTAGANATDVMAELANYSKLKAQADIDKDVISKLKDNLAKEREAKVTNLVNDAVAQGKILEGERATYTEDATANYDLVKRLLDKTPAKNSLPLAGSKGAAVANASDRKDWDLDKWQTKDPQGLMARKAADPEWFESLVDAYTNS